MKRKSLNGMTWDHPRAYKGLEAASAIYASKFGVHISWRKRSLQAFADAPIEQLANENDLIILDHPHVGLIAEAESLLPLQMPEDASFSSLGGSLESYLWKDQLWAYPIDAACQVAVKRADLCGKELLDWEAVLEGSFGLPIVTPLLPVDAFDMMMTLIAGCGEEDLPNSPTKFCTDANGILSLKVLKALFKAGPSEAVRWNPIKALESMSTTNDFAYSPCLFGYINYSYLGFRKHQLSYCNLPSFRGSKLKRGILGGAGIGVSAKSAHPQDAVDFARWITSEPIQSGVYLENEGQPAHKESWRRMGPDPRYSGFMHGAMHTMENAWTRPRDVWFLEFVDQVCEIFPTFFLKDRDEEAFLKDINAIYLKHLEKST